MISIRSELPGTGPGEPRFVCDKVVALKKILLADDDPAIRLLVNATLRSDQYQIIEASDGQEALTLARREHPDLILLDVSMPKVDGFEVCRRLKEDPSTAEIRIIMLTGHTLDADRQAGAALGADGYFTKPFSPLALLDRIADVLQ
jgi:CheY-like chemotaxis protein